MKKDRSIKIATRGSRLALAQTDIVIRLLREKGYAGEPVVVHTRGDRNQKPIAEIGGDGLFVREIERTLLSGEADIAVHSAKDLPYELMEGLLIAGVPEAGDPRDVLLARAGDMDRVLSGGDDISIGTGSMRRQQEYRRSMGDAAFIPIRGNIDTRMKKLLSGEVDGIILAKAGIDRLGADMAEMDMRIFSTEEMIPAASQGIIAIECRADDDEMTGVLSEISDPESKKRFEAERRIFKDIGADCHEAVGVYAYREGAAGWMVRTLYNEKTELRPL